MSLAMRGRGCVEPNPMVGCVIAKGDRIIGEGWHRRYGQAHAEPNALAACTESPEGATVCVTLEPCCHHQKQTPPCVPRLIQAKVARVVVGCQDPNPQVAGQGVQELRAAGIVVDVGICEAACRQLIAPFYISQCGDRPYVTLKWAQTRDGKVAGPRGQRLQITGAQANSLVHKLRSHCDAILVGVNTVLIDDPLLTVRGHVTERQLRRVVLDRHLRTPLHSRLVQSAREHELIICCSATADPEKMAALRSAGAHVEIVDGLLGALHFLKSLRVTHLLVESGPTLAAEFFRLHLADRIWIFWSETVVADHTAPAAPTLPNTLRLVAERPVGADHLREYLDTESAAFFSLEASADFVCADAPPAWPA